MKKKWIILISVCVVLVLAAVAVACWFFSPGVHFFWNLANFNLKDENCYIISNGEVIDQTTMTFEGVYRYTNGPVPKWDYTFKIAGYSDIAEGKQVYDTCSAMKSGGKWTALYWVYVDDSDQDIYIEKNQEAVIMITMDFVENKPVAKIAYDGKYERDAVWAVCADSEEEALRLYSESREK